MEEHTNNMYERELTRISSEQKLSSTEMTVSPSENMVTLEVILN